jgi:hypothetical protein
MVGVGQKSGQNGVGSSGSSSFDGADNVENFPGVPYGAGGEYKTTEAEAGTWGVQERQNVPRSAWVKTDAASVWVSTDVAFAVLLAASVFTHALRGTFCTPCTPPQLPDLNWVKGVHFAIFCPFAVNRLRELTPLYFFHRLAISLFYLFYSSGG